MSKKREGGWWMLLKREAWVGPREKGCLMYHTVPKSKICQKEKEKKRSSAPTFTFKISAFKSSINCCCSLADSLERRITPGNFTLFICSSPGLIPLSIQSSFPVISFQQNVDHFLVKQYRPYQVQFFYLDFIAFYMEKIWCSVSLCSNILRLAPISFCSRIGSNIACYLQSRGPFCNQEQIKFKHRGEVLPSSLGYLDATGKSKITFFLTIHR